MFRKNSKIPLYNKFSSKLIVLVLSIAIIPLVFTILIGFNAFEKSIEKRTIDDLTLIAEAKEGHLFGYMENVLSRTVDFSSDGFIRDATQQILDNPDNKDVFAQLNQHLLVNKMPLDKTIYGINIIGPDGMIIASTNEVEIGTNEGDDEYFTYAKDLSYGESYMGKIGTDYHFREGEPIIIAAAPLVNQVTNEKIGILVNYYSSSHLDDVLSGVEQVNLGALTGLQGRSETLDIYLVNSDKLLITESRFLGKDVFLKQLADTKPVRACLESREEISGSWIDYRGVQVYGSAMCIVKHGHNWTLLAEMDESEVLAPVVALKKIMTSITFVVILLGVFLAIFFSRRLTKPIEILTDVVEKIGQGDLNIRAEIKSKDEIGKLSKSFNKMTADLQAEQVRTEKYLQELETVSGRLKLATESAKIGVWDWDVVNDALWWDDQVYKIYGIKKEDFGGAYEAWQKGLHPDDAKRAEEEVAMALSGEKKLDTTFRVVWPNGSIHDVRALATVKRDESGKPVSLTGVNWDVTEEEELDRVKDEFISIASHQLRTPLTGIRWVVERFMKNMDQFSEKDKEYLQSVQVSSAQLTLLVDQLLNVSRIESGGIGIVPTKVDVVASVKSAVNEFLPISAARGVIVTFNSSKDKIIAETDVNALHNIVQSITSNAIEYTQKGGRVLVAVKKGEETFSITISDTGIGIPKEEIPKLFAKFQRAENAKKFKPGGTGLGLFIVKQAVSLLDGTILVESEVGKGTTFYVTLPLVSKEKEGEKRFV